VVVGSSTYDGQAAARAGMKFVGVLTGGFTEEELRKAGAIAVYRELAELIGEPAWT